MKTTRIRRLVTLCVFAFALAACDEQPKPEQGQPSNTSVSAADAGTARDEPAEPGEVDTDAPVQRQPVGSCPLTLAFEPSDTVTGVQDSQSPKTLIQVKRDGKTFNIQATCIAAPDLKLKEHIDKVVASIAEKHEGKVDDLTEVSADGASGWQFGLATSEELSRVHFFHHAGRTLVYMAISGKEGVDAFTAQMLEGLDWHDGEEAKK